MLQRGPVRHTVISWTLVLNQHPVYDMYDLRMFSNTKTVESAELCNILDTNSPRHPTSITAKCSL